MAGAMKKMAVYLGLVEDEYDEYVDDATAEAPDAYEQAAAQQRAAHDERRARSQAPAVATLTPRASRASASIAAWVLLPLPSTPSSAMKRPATRGGPRRRPRSRRR